MMEFNIIERVSPGSDFINILFLGSLLFLIFSKLVLINRTLPVFPLSDSNVEDRNFTLYTTICTFIYSAIISAIVLYFLKQDALLNRFFKNINAHYRYLIIFGLIAVFLIVKILIRKLYFIIIDDTVQYKNRTNYQLLFIKLVIAYLIFIVIYYVNLDTDRTNVIAITLASLLLITQWIYLLFFSKIKIKFPNLYEILYICAVEILPAICGLKLMLS